MRKRWSSLTLLAAFWAWPAFSQGQSGEHVSGQLLVQHRVGANRATANAVLARVGARIQKEMPQLGVSVISVPEPAADAIAAVLTRTGLFNFVERDGIAHPAQTLVTPNDPNFPSQWHLAKIQGPSAWALTTGSSAVTIAVIDSGVESTHPDLSSKLVPGWNFVTGTSTTADDLGHGTAVAGTAAAATDNATGVAGVSWTNMIMPLVVLDSTGYASYSNIASAITYAADHGARVMNISIGGSSASSTLQSAVDYAWNKGAVIFASAMNNSSSIPYYPAACNNVVSVSSTDSNDNLASFSDYGSWIDLSAPGTSILTTMTGASYGYWQGTSFSSPIVAATAALVVSKNPSLSASSLVSLLEQNSDVLPVGSTGWNQYFGWGRINVYKALLAAGVASTIDTTPPTVTISSPGNGATLSGTVTIQASATDNVGVTQMTLLIDNQQVSSTSSSSLAYSWVSTGVANGTHTITVNASDAAGNLGTASISVNVSNSTATSKDTTPPVVSITSPLNGSRITATNLQIAVAASDNVGVTQVSIYVDNVLRCTDTSAPYSCAWNTKKAGSGTHVITANAWDAAGNVASATPVTVTK